VHPYKWIEGSDSFFIRSHWRPLSLACPLAESADKIASTNRMALEKCMLRAFDLVGVDLFLNSLGCVSSISCNIQKQFWFIATEAAS
jgi:hypothetical protein